jgi:threonine dehydratase
VSPDRPSPTHPSPTRAAPTFSDVEAAAVRVAPFVHHTPVMTSHLLDEWLDAEVFLKCEHLQRIGAFKYRGATNAVQSLTSEAAAHGVAAHSSGNHAAALALAAQTRGIAAHIVVPSTAARAKRAAVVSCSASRRSPRAKPPSRR